MAAGLAVTSDLSFEFYGQPYVSKDTFPADAKAAFTFTPRNSNAVVRWEYRPGSTLFLVWSPGCEQSTNEETQQTWLRDHRGLFRLHPQNPFLIKVAYWLNR
jgi:hypothetical protein